MTEHDTERVRIKALLAGEPAAFDRFFKEYFPRLYRFVLPRVENRPDCAQDICQEALARALRRLHTYRGEAAPFTWLCQIARNTLADYWRKQGKERTHLVYAEDDPHVRAVLESLETDAEDSLEARRYDQELGRAVHVVLDHLPSRYSDALEWKYVEGLGITEIAGRLGSTVIAAQSILQRARAAFREAFEAMAFDQDRRLKP